MGGAPKEPPERFDTCRPPGSAVNVAAAAAPVIASLGPSVDVARLPSCSSGHGTAGAGSPGVFDSQPPFSPTAPPSPPMLAACVRSSTSTSTSDDSVSSRWTGEGGARSSQTSDAADHVDVAAALATGSGYPALGARLRIVMRLQLHDTLRDLYPCFGNDCRCTGAFYKDFYCSKSKLVAVVGMDDSGASTPAARDTLRHHFRTHRPQLHLMYGSKLCDACVATAKWVPVPASVTRQSATSEPRSASGSASASAAAARASSEAGRAVASSASAPAGEWHFTLRPRLRPEFGQLVRCVASVAASADSDASNTVNDNNNDNNDNESAAGSTASEVDAAGRTVTSRPFEIRTKPSEWLCLEGLPASWRADAVKHLVMHGQPPRAGARVFRHAKTQPAPLRCMVHLDGNVGTGYAFVQYASRVQARTALLALMVAVAARGARPAHASLAFVTGSMIGSMNRNLADDPGLNFIRKPSFCVRGEWAAQAPAVPRSPSPLSRASSSGGVSVASSTVSSASAGGSSYSSAASTSDSDDSAAASVASLRASVVARRRVVVRCKAAGAAAASGGDGAGALGGSAGRTPAAKRVRSFEAVEYPTARARVSVMSKRRRTRADVSAALDFLPVALPVHVGAAIAPVEVCRSPHAGSPGPDTSAQLPTPLTLGSICHQDDDDDVDMMVRDFFGPQAGSMTPRGAGLMHEQAWDFTFSDAAGGPPDLLRGLSFGSVGLACGDAAGDHEGIVFDFGVSF